MICCRGVALFKADVMAILLGRQYLHASPQSGSDLPFLLQQHHFARGSTRCCPVLIDVSYTTI